MTLKNEIMEGITAYKALTPSSQDKYYDVLMSEAKRKQKEAEDLDKLGTNAVAAENARRAGLAVPTKASTATPGTAATRAAPSDSGGFGPATAFNAGAPSFGDQLSRGYRRGGRVTKRFQEGGAVDDRSEADRILEEMLSKNELSENVDPAAEYADRGVTDRATAARADTNEFTEGGLKRTALPPSKSLPLPERQPPDPLAAAVNRVATAPREPLFSPQGDIVRDNTIDEVRRRRVENAERSIPVGVDTSPPGMEAAAFEPSPVAGETGGEPLVERQRGPSPTYGGAKFGGAKFGGQTHGISSRPAEPPAEPPMRDVDETGGIPEGDREERTSAAQRFFGTSRKPYDLNQKILELERQKLALEPSVFTGTTASERAKTTEEVGKIDAQIEALRNQKAAATAAPSDSAAKPALQTNAPSAARPAGAGDPSVYGRPAGPRQATGGEPDLGEPASPYLPVKPGGGAGTGGGVRTGTGSGGGAGGTGGGSSGPGNGTGATPPPPPGRGGAREEAVDTRTAAFDPGRERIGPQGQTMARQLDQQGQVVYPTAQETNQMAAQGMLASGAQPGGPAPAIGDGALSRDNYRSLIAQNNQGGKLTEGQAAMVAMHAKFKELIRRGKPKEAATMAWGIIQAANLEAASLGMVARDQLQSGDIAGSRKTLAAALDHAPDGMTHKATPYGIETSDQNGNVTARSVIDGKKALAIALGLADGSLMWDMLQGAVKSQQPADKGAEGRRLRNELTTLQIEGARRRLNKLQGGGQGEGGEAQRLRSILNSGSSNVTAPPRGGSNNVDSDSWISASAANSGDEGENNA